MPKTKEQKQQILDDLEEKFNKQKSVVFVDFSGLGVKDITELRKKMREKDCEFKVAKKTLIQGIFKKSEPEKGVKIRNLQGEIALGFGYTDEILPFKILGDFSKINQNLKLLGGLMGNEFLEANRAIAMSELPSKQELLAKLVGSVSAPISGFINTLQGNIKGLIYVLAKAKT